MNNSFINELKQLTQNPIQIHLTGIGFVAEIKGCFSIHFIELKKLNYNISLPEFSFTCNFPQITLFENDWNEKREIVVSRLNSLLGSNCRIAARKTKFLKINRLEAYEFLCKNHFNVPVKAKYNFGLFFENELVAIACFGPIMHKKNENKGEYSGELIRFCSKTGYTVTGALSKLLKHFTNIYSVNDIMTYIDKDWSDGKSFIKVGFEKVGENNRFTHFFNPTTQHFESESKKTIAIKKNGLLKLIKKIEPSNN